MIITKGDDLMKKFLVLFLCLLFSSVALADTITFAATNCGHYRVCNNIANDTTSVISMNANSGYPGVAIDLDGVEYTAPSGNVIPIIDLQLTASDGSVIVLDATFVLRRFLVRSGHNFYVWYWQLIEGTITR